MDDSHGFALRPLSDICICNSVLRIHVGCIGLFLCCCSDSLAIKYKIIDDIR